MQGNKVRISLSLFLLALFVTFKASLSMFAHAHYVDGVAIVHSHPYSDKSHTHTVPQIITLAGMSALQAVEPSAVTVAELSPTLLCSEVADDIVEQVLPSYAGIISLRAPPVCCWPKTHLFRL